MPSNRSRLHRCSVEKATCRFVENTCTFAHVCMLKTGDRHPNYAHTAVRISAMPKNQDKCQLVFSVNLF